MTTALAPTAPVEPVLPADLQTPGEELFNTISHGAGALLAIIGLVFMLLTVTDGGDSWQIVSATIYGITLILLYLASTLYHALPPGKAKRVFRRFDHIGIYLLIAGSYTIIALTELRDSVGWHLFGIEWGIAAFGITFKAVFGPRYELISTLGYVAMGWVVVFFIGDVVAELPTGGLILLGLGGLFYTGGVPFILMDQKRRYFHSIWHLFVLGGSICHYFMAYYYLV